MPDRTAPVRILTFTDGQLRDMILNYWFMEPPQLGLKWAATNVAEMVQQAWLEQQRGKQQ